MSKEERSILQFLYDIIEFIEDLQVEITIMDYTEFVNNKMAILFAGGINLPLFSYGGKNK